MCVNRAAVKSSISDQLENLWVERKKEKDWRFAWADAWRFPVFDKRFDRYFYAWTVI